MGEGHGRGKLLTHGSQEADRDRKGPETRCTLQRRAPRDILPPAGPPPNSPFSTNSSTVNPPMK
jgi:hypothetical protein